MNNNLLLKRYDYNSSWLLFYKISMKNFKAFSLMLLYILPLTLSAQEHSVKKKAVSTSVELHAPKLIVGLVIDQMRWDYLIRYADKYGDGGFKRLLNQGFSCNNTQADYIPTVTAAGHTGIYTGSVPSLTGIAGNDWIDKASGKSVYCTSDSTVQTVGSSSTAGQMSPRNLWSTTITDELKLATNFRSKVIGIALKDRGGILPAGHSANAAYWFDDATGNWITSTYYMNQLPNWVTDFNNQKIANKYLQQDWNTLYPINTYVQSEPDNNLHEGLYKGETSPVFPHLAPKDLKSGYGIIRSTPWGNTFTLDFAKKTILEEHLGSSAITDFLAVSLSSTDYIGHQFGPNSVEIEDTYLRLDKDLASLFNFLDNQIGNKNYTVFLTADHGAAHNPNFLKDHKIPAGIESNKILKELNAQLKTEFTVENLVLTLNNYQVNFNESALKSATISRDNLKKSCINFLQKQNCMAYVVDMGKIAEASIPKPLKEKMINGYNSERSGDIQMILKPGYFLGYGPTGTTHGTWNPYDTHIPLVFMGWGIKKGSSFRRMSMCDIAPTLAALLHIQPPNANIGEPIEEVLKAQK
jgi:predicted AlkP superfamily pyrophosphatase or phosphodiesterase